MESNTNTKMTFADVQLQMQMVKARQGAGYAFRNAEDILNKFKSLNSGWSLVVSDEVLEIGGKLLIRATATATLEGQQPQASSKYVGVGPVPLSRAGAPMMSEPQWWGACSSYASKYAMQGLFGIGDQDVDSFPVPQVVEVEQPVESPQTDWEAILMLARTLDTVPELQSLWREHNFSEAPKYVRDGLLEIVESVKTRQ